MENNITAYLTIKDGKVLLNGEIQYESNEQNDFQTFIKEVYKEFKLDYPKFYKMDALCKLALVAGSILLDSVEEIDSETAIILSNKSSCIDIDIKHQASISEGEESYASPAVFVYTLPNIAIGEISIKYKLRSENSFFIFEDFNPSFLVDYTNSLLTTNKASSVISGWIEVNNNEYNASLFLVGPGKGLALTSDKLQKLI